MGWPCFGSAGEGVTVNSVPVTWAPGQGVVNYPDGMGVPIRTTDKIVVQIHYNLADPTAAGKTDSTTVHLRFANQVSRRLSFLLPDPFLDSLSKKDVANNPAPDTLPPMLPPGNQHSEDEWHAPNQIGKGARMESALSLIIEIDALSGT